MIIVGATSAIAQAVMRRLVSGSARFVLIARNAERVEQVAQDLRSRGAADVSTIVRDLDELESHPELVERSWSTLGGCDLLLLAHGTLPIQVRCQDSVDETLKAFRTNALSSISLLTLFAGKFAAQRAGSIAVISSVAGDRGRRSNYVYGSTKAALTAFTSGLRSRLATAGVHVLTVKPGLVDTPMTADFKKGALWASPESVGAKIVSALEKRRDVAYAPWFWRPVMFGIRSVPERFFKLTNL